MVWGGIGVAALGVVGLAMGDPEYYDDPLNTLNELSIIAGSALVATGITFRIVGKYTVKKAVNTYNAGQYSSSLGYTPELQLGFTGNGVGLVYRF